MVKRLKEKIFVRGMDKNIRDTKVISRLIGKSTSRNKKAKVILLVMGPRARPHSGKISNPKRFFSSFCKVLAQCGISSTFVHGLNNLERSITNNDGVPIILINMIHELYDNSESYRIPQLMFPNISAVFNSHKAAKLVRDKEEMNNVFSRNGIPMPALAPRLGQKIFSNTRTGTHDPVFIYESMDVADKNRYNTEYIDTRVDFQGRSYFTSVRLNCIGSRILQINVRASDEAEGTASVTGTDTPLDRDLLHHLHNSLVVPYLEEYSMLAKSLEAVLGPGFFAHDTLVHRDTGKLYLSEAGFKFMSAAYATSHEECNWRP